MASSTQRLKETDAFGSLLENQKVKYSRPLELLDEFYTSCVACSEVMLQCFSNMIVEIFPQVERAVTISEVQNNALAHALFKTVTKPH